MKLGIVFGANSFEHEISIISAIVMKKVLKTNLQFIFVDKFRDFYLIPSEKLRANLFSSEEYKKCKQLNLVKGGFEMRGVLGAKRLEIDCYVNLIHGKDGEDGKIAGIFEFFGISFVGPRLEASVMTFNKELTKLLAQKCGVATLSYEVIKREKIINTPYPIILKPLRLGSSIGVKVVKEPSELDYALDTAFEFDDEVLVEPFVSGVRELNLGFKAGDEFVFSAIEEPRKDEFLDFKQKYLGFSGEIKSPKAEISVDLEQELKAAFASLYDGGHFQGALIRCDFFIINDKVFLNEINPNPGSLANYLFDDFSFEIQKLASKVKPEKNVNITYKFINSIVRDKGGDLV